MSSPSSFEDALYSIACTMLIGKGTDVYFTPADEMPGVYGDIEAKDGFITIRVRENLSPENRFMVLIHECTHAVLHFESYHNTTTAIEQAVPENIRIASYYAQELQANKLTASWLALCADIEPPLQKLAQLLRLSKVGALPRQVASC